MLIEGSGFALVIGVYLYFRALAGEWPLGAPPPGLQCGHADHAVAAGDRAAEHSRLALGGSDTSFGKCGSGSS